MERKLKQKFPVFLSIYNIFFLFSIHIFVIKADKVEQKSMKWNKVEQQGIFLDSYFFSILFLTLPCSTKYRRI